MTMLLEVQNVAAWYGQVKAVNNVSLSVRDGSVVSIVGPNGAGKSTLLNTIMGMHGGGSQGAILFNGKPFATLPAETRLLRGLCLVPEKRELFASMSVEDNLLLGAYVRSGNGPIDLQPVYDRFPRLQERRRQLAGTLSGGERQMLAIGRALMSKPTLLMLDEPSLGLAPKIVEDVFKVIEGLKAGGVSILLVEQNARAALAVSDFAYVLELGEIVLQGTGANLARDERVVASYLGLETSI